MSSTHKAALARGRDEGRVVRRYLEALEHNRPKRGRKRTPESVKKRLDAVHEQLTSAEPLARLHLLQERADLQVELDRATSTNDLATLEKAFVKVARGLRGAQGHRVQRVARRRSERGGAPARRHHPHLP